jgi:DinB superfamily
MVANGRGKDAPGGGPGKRGVHERLVARLAEQARDVERLTAGLDEGPLTNRTIPDKWSLKELVGHLWRTQQVFEGRLDAMLTQENPTLASWGADNDPDYEAMLRQSAHDLVLGYLGARQALLGRLSALRPAQWHRGGRHPDYPSYDVHFMIEYLAHHEAHHMYQMYQRRTPLGKIPH